MKYNTGKVKAIVFNNLAGDVIAFIRVSLRVLYGAFVPIRYCLLRFSMEMILWFIGL